MFLLDFFKKKDFKKVLSLDGGGVRALAAVIFLKQLEKETGKSVFDGCKCRRIERSSFYNK